MKLSPVIICGRAKPLKTGRIGEEVSPVGERRNGEGFPDGRRGVCRFRKRGEGTGCLHDLWFTLGLKTCIHRGLVGRMDAQGDGDSLEMRGAQTGFRRRYAHARSGGEERLRRSGAGIAAPRPGEGFSGRRPVQTDPQRLLSVSVPPPPGKRPAVIFVNGRMCFSWKKDTEG